jgi:hypothetical protein
MLFRFRLLKKGFNINTMVELVRTNNWVMLSWLVAQLREENIEPVILDYNISIVEGSIGAFPRRVMVDEVDYPQARVILAEAEAIERKPQPSKDVPS